MAVSEEMILRIDQFYGIDQSADDASTPLGAAFKAVNFDTAKGNLKVMGGCVEAFEKGISGRQIRRIMPFYRRGDSGMLLAFCYDGQTEGRQLYYTNDARKGEWYPLENPSTQLGEHIYSQINYQRENDDIFMFADGTWLKYWNGVDPEIVRVEVPYAPLGLRYIALGNERVWGAGIAGKPDRIHYSKAYNPTDWYDNEADPDLNGGYIDLPTWEKGGRIVGLCEAFGDMIVFKEHDIFRIFGEYPSQFSIDRLSGVEGPVSNDAIVKYNNCVYYLSKNGLCCYDGARVMKLNASDKVREAWAGLPYETLSSAKMTLFEDKLYFSLPKPIYRQEDMLMTMEVQPNASVLVYDLKRNTFMEREGITPNSFTAFRFETDGSKKEYLLFSQNSEGVFRFDEEAQTYMGMPIKAYWETPWMDMKRKDVVKTVTLTYAVGSGAPGACFVVEAISERKKKKKVVQITEQDRLIRARTKIKGRRIKFRFANYLDAEGEPGEENYAPAIEALPLELNGGIQFTVELEQD